MKSWYLVLLVMLVAPLSACQDSNRAQIQHATQTLDPPPLLDLGPAPELQNEVWLNTQTPLRLADLRGQVVLLEMWTYG